ncbi:MAG: hypothetical protein ABSH08_09035 [Tepidisphaeraceae bacterium]|jgi:hypothetical protein
MSKYKYARFHPWVGERYDCSPWGFRAMVLGESHYDTEGAKPAGFTITVVGRVVNCEDKGYRSRLFPRTAQLFLKAAEDRWANRCERHAFWQNMLFYNYIQEYVAEKPGIRPTKEVWEDSKNANAFGEVVCIHRPDLILVLGKELWSYVEKCPTMKSSHIVTVPINHPAWPGWGYKRWIPCLTDAIKKTRRS